MQSHIIKVLVIVIFSLLPLFVVVPKTAAQSDLTLVISAEASRMEGSVRTATYSPIGERVWVKWVDNLGNIRYTQADSNGSYIFESWQKEDRSKQYNTWIKPDHPEIAPIANSPTDLSSQGYTRQSSTEAYDGFGCIENPHKITAVKPYNWSGSFSNEDYGVTNGGINNDLLRDTFPDIIYTPGPNSASCISQITAPSSVTAGQEFQATVSIRNNTPYSTWTSQNNYRLGRWDNNGWVFPNGNQDRFYLPSSVDGGATANFTFPVIAPNSAGNKTLSVRMVQDGREWFGEICSKPITVNGVVTTLPSIQGINVINGGGSGSAVRTSGSKTDQQGTGYNNPLTITLNATAGKNGDIDVPSTFYVAFYKQTTGQISSDFINSATNKLADPTNGVLFAYDQTNNRCGGSHCVFDPVTDRWQNISGDSFGSRGYPIGDILTVYPGNKDNYSAEKQWRVNFDKTFGSKSMFTSAYVFDSNGKSAFIGGDISPATQ